MIQLSDVRVFLQILDNGSFTSAAKALKVPKSSVARQLQRLEKEVGCELLLRTTRSVALTDEGRAFLPHARRLLDDSIEATNATRRNADGARGLVTVSTSSTFGRAFIAPLLPRFLKRHPGVRVSLNLTPAKIGIGIDQADIAIRLGPIVEPRLGVRRLGQIDFWLVATPRYLKGRRPIEEPVDLSKHDLIELRPPASDNRLDLMRHRKVQSVRCVPIVEINDPDAVKTVVLADCGIGTLPTFLVAKDVAEGRLVRVLAEWAPAPANISLLFNAAVAPPFVCAPSSTFFARP